MKQKITKEKTPPSKKKHQAPFKCWHDFFIILIMGLTFGGGITCAIAEQQIATWFCTVAFASFILGMYLIFACENAK